MATECFRCSEMHSGAFQVEYFLNLDDGSLSFVDMMMMNPPSLLIFVISRHEMSHILNLQLLMELFTPVNRVWPQLFCHIYAQWAIFYQFM